MLKKWLVLLATVAMMLTACNAPVYNQTENNVADVKLKTVAALKKSDASGNNEPALTMSKGLYIDKTPISLYKNPSWMKRKIVIRGDNLPFSYYARTISSGAGGYVLTKYQTGLDKGLRTSVNYSGTVRGALDLLASKTGYVYSISGNSIYWRAFITKTYDIAFMPGSTGYLMGKSSDGAGAAGGAGGGGGGGQSQTSDFSTTDDASAQYSSLRGELSVWNDIQSTIAQLISPDGKVSVSQATTTVTVRDRPTNINLVTQYVKNLNSKLSKQVLVKIQVLEVDLASDYNMGVNWSLVASAFKNSPFVLNGNYGTPISITNLSTSVLGVPTSVITNTTLNTGGTPVFGTVGNGQIPSYSILVNALSQQGKTSVVSEPRVVCLNNQVSVVRINEQEGYVASVQNTTLSGDTGGGTNNTVTSQITPGNLITGITLYILPKIMGKKIYLQVNADLSTKKNIRTFESGDSRVELPEVASKSFNQRSMIRSGETLILSGFRQIANRANAQQLMKSQALGGKASTQETSETIMLITPIILNGST